MPFWVWHFFSKQKKTKRKTFWACQRWGSLISVCWRDVKLFCRVFINPFCSAGICVLSHNFLWELCYTPSTFVMDLRNHQTEFSCRVAMYVSVSVLYNKDCDKRSALIEYACFFKCFAQINFLFPASPIATYNWSFFIKLLEITVLQQMINMIHYSENSAL